MRTSSASCSEELTRTQDSLTSSQHENSELAAKWEHSAKEAQALLHTLQQLESTHHTLQQTLHTQEAEVKRTQQMLQHTETDLGQTQGSLQSTEKELTRTRQSLQKLELESARTQQSLQRVEEEGVRRQAQQEEEMQTQQRKQRLQEAEIQRRQVFVVCVLCSVCVCVFVCLCGLFGGRRNMSVFCYLLHTYPAHTTIVSGIKSYHHSSSILHPLHVQCHLPSSIFPIRSSSCSITHPSLVDHAAGIITHIIITRSSRMITPHLTDLCLRQARGTQSAATSLTASTSRESNPPVWSTHTQTHHTPSVTQGKA